MTDTDWRPGALPPDWSDFGLTDQGTGWQERGLCAQTDPEAFFPEQGGSTRAAKAVCGRCEVRAECLAYALANSVEGIWGALTERERRKVRQGGNAPVFEPPAAPAPEPAPEPAQVRELPARKVCTRCSVDKPADEFYLNQRQLQSRCIACVKELRNERHAAGKVA